ncbi:uncharacterized protein LOC123551765 [Mercenaria mercenaria]|uniref:uncharacterized protein LOC123551765 n=1 Tax=Mercenaria mercenaria TaxID=6596 RepID=UPI00234F019D|nr:uncharacterized protein LOC123551765 [Mercenaria mercenaria]
MDSKVSMLRRVKSCGSYWICLFFFFFLKEKVAASEQILQESGAYEEISHYGTEFILGMTDYERVLHIASEQQGTFNISVPGSGITKIGYIAIGNTTVNVDTNIYPGVRQKNGLHIVTSVPVSIYVSDKGYVSRYGAFLALPVTFMGKLYVVPAYKQRFFGVVIAAVYENTSVAVAHFLNKSETVILPKILDTFTTIGYEEERSSTVILANEPVSVITGTSRDEGESHSSILVKQVLPYDAWTNEYIIPPLPPNTRYMIRILSMENQTVCFKTINNNACYDLNTVSNIKYVHSTETLVVISNAPISIIQHGTNMCNKTEYGPETFPFMILIPGIKNFLNKYSFVIPDLNSSSEHFVVAIVPSSKTSELLIDGSLVTFDYSFNVSASLEDYTVLIKSISIGYHVMHHADPQVRFGAIAYGTDGGQCTSPTSRSYGFALGYTFRRTKYNIGFNNWSEWSKCSATCDVGNQFRERSCKNKMNNEEHGCSGHKGETRQCLLQICTDNSAFDSWTSWSVCSRSCGGGVQSREIVCLKSVNTNKTCRLEGTFTESRLCNTSLCPVDGDFSVWSAWSDCSVTCDTGLQDRARSCDNPRPSNGGKLCIGAREEAKSCFRGMCKGDDISSDRSKGNLIIILSVVAGVVAVAVSAFVIYWILSRKCNDCALFRRLKEDTDSMLSVRGDTSDV